MQAPRDPGSVHINLCCVHLFYCLCLKEHIWSGLTTWIHRAVTIKLHKGASHHHLCYVFPCVILGWGFSFIKGLVHFLKKTFADNLIHTMKTRFSPYNGLHWEPNGSRSKWEFQCSLNNGYGSYLDVDILDDIGVSK